MGETVWSANRPWMCEAHAAAAHETAAEALASEPAADSMPAEAATGVPTTEAAAAMTTAATTPARFSDAGRGSDNNCRSKCSFYYER